MNKYWFYILASKMNGALYVGVTSDLVKRVYQHKKKLIDSFTSKYFIDKLVYTEEFNSIIEAIHREKCIKKWKRDWKIRLIQDVNPDWNDLYGSII